MNETAGIGGHQSARMGKDEWLTPPEIVEALGPFTLDPCAPVNRPWDTAEHHYTVEDDGLVMPWGGRVWCNPPYGKHTADWLAKCALHRNVTALVFARTETTMFFKWVWPFAVAAMFVEGRIHFYHGDGTRATANSGAPSVLIAWDQYNAERLRDSGIKGRYVDL